MFTNMAICRQCQRLSKMTCPGLLPGFRRIVFSRPFTAISGFKPRLQPSALNLQRFSTSDRALSEDRWIEGEEKANQLRFNELNVQMLSRSLHEQLFNGKNGNSSHDGNLFEEVKRHLEKFNLWNKKTKLLPDVDFRLPTLLGTDIEEHFYKLGLQQAAAYRTQADTLSENELPPLPTVNIVILLHLHSKRIEEIITLIYYN